MKLLKKILPPLFTVLLAASAVFLPPTLSRLRDSVTLSGVHVEQKTPATPAAELTMLDKLALLSRWRRDSSSIIRNEQLVDYSSYEERLSSTQNALKELQATGLLLSGLSPGEYDNKGGMITTYTDLTDLSRSVVIWEFAYFIDGWEFNITMDAETEKIIELSYNQIDGPNSFASFEDGVDTSIVDTDTLLKPFRNYAEYLGFAWTKIDTDNAPFLIRAETEDPNVSYNFVFAEDSAYSIHLDF